MTAPDRPGGTSEVPIRASGGKRVQDRDGMQDEWAESLFLQHNQGILLIWTLLYLMRE